MWSNEHESVFSKLRFSSDSLALLPTCIQSWSACLLKSGALVSASFNRCVDPRENVGDQVLENPGQAADKLLSDWLETHQVQTIKQSWEANAIAQSLTASQENRVYFATFYKWNGLNGPIGAELILEQLRQFLGNT